MDMSGETGGGGEGWDRYEILIISMNGRFWLLKGEAHLMPILSGGDDFPKPIGVIVIESALLLRNVVPESVDLGDLWMIQANVMARLREREVLVEIRPEP